MHAVVLCNDWCGCHLAVSKQMLYCRLCQARETRTLVTEVLEVEVVCVNPRPDARTARQRHPLLQDAVNHSLVQGE